SFEKIGVKAEIVTYDWATYLDKVRKGEADAFLMGWTGDNGDPDNFIYTLLDKYNIGGNNYTYFSNDELHDILIESQSDPDQKKRNKLYQDAQELLHEES
ncbi:ABC transporter substrate-binding protein, partial [Bacillus licheniformis]|uniref:ABC transporter substrate-binding protein n=1 Tax=Bacillus licheniformis TaxID=1402 RepID=UPI003D0E9E83